MALDASPELLAAINAPERTALVRVRMDWDGDGYGTTTVLPDGRTVDIDDLTRHAGAVSIDRTLATELPEQVRVVAGSAAAAASVDLNRGDPGDESLDAAAYFTRGSARSPVGGKERLRRSVTVDIGMVTSAGPQYVRRLTGLSRRLPTTTGQQRTAALEVLDNRERLRDLVTLIPGSGPLSGYDGTFVVCQAWHACGFHAGPAPRDDVMLWQPCYGSLLPIIPRPADNTDWALMFVPGGGTGPRPGFVTGPFVLAHDGGYFNSDSDYARPQLLINPADPTWEGLAGRVELWVYGVASPSTGPTGSSGRHIVALVTAGQEGTYAVVQHDGRLALFNRDFLGVTLHSYVSTLAVSADGRWHAVGISWDHTAQQGVFHLDGRVEVVTTSISTSEMDGAVTVQATGYAPYSDLQVSAAPIGAGWLAADVAPNAVIDPSTLQLEACHESRSREVWELVTEIAACEQAVVTCDEEGVPSYRTRRRLIDDVGQTVQRTLRADTADLLEVDVDDGIDQIRNIAQVSYRPVEVMAAGVVCEDTAQRSLLSDSSMTVVVSFLDPVLDLDTGIALIDIGSFESADPTGSMLAATLNDDYTDDGGAVMAYDGLIVATVLEWTPAAATVQIVNHSGVTVYFASLLLYGIRCVVGNQVTAEARHEGSIDTFGSQPLPLSMPQWVQHSDVARSLAAAVIGDLRAPRRTIARILAVGDPTRQLGDREAIDYPTRPELDGEYWLTAIKDQLSDTGGYTQVLALREASTVLRWGIGRWGVDTWG